MVVDEDDPLSSPKNRTAAASMHITKQADRQLFELISAVDSKSFDVKTARKLRKELSIALHPSGPASEPSDDLPRSPINTTKAKSRTQHIAPFEEFVLSDDAIKPRAPKVSIAGERILFIAYSVQKTVASYICSLVRLPDVEAMGKTCTPGPGYYDIARGKNAAAPSRGMVQRTGKGIIPFSPAKNTSRVLVESSQPGMIILSIKYITVNMMCEKDPAITTWKLITQGS